MSVDANAINALIGGADITVIAVNCLMLASENRITGVDGASIVVVAANIRILASLDWIAGVRGACIFVITDY